MARLFGTDGVRGVANDELTPMLAMQLGQAGAYVLSKEKEHKPGVDKIKNGVLILDLVKTAHAAQYPRGVKEI